MSLITIKIRKNQYLAISASLVLWLTFVPAAFAGHGVMTGFFKGAEPQTKSVGAICDPAGTQMLIYQTFAGVRASVAGSYNFSDTGHHGGRNTQIAFYTSFNPSSPAANRVGFVEYGFPGSRSISLQSGVNYTVVIQACGAEGNSRGEWSFAYNGPGSLSGPSLYDTPAWSSGTFNGSDSSLPQEIVCGTTYYQVTGPIRVPQTGEYFYSDSSTHWGVDIILIIYDGPFNPSSPFSHFVVDLDDGGSVQLKAGVDYYMLVQPYCENDMGDFEYVLLGPQVNFQITEGLNGAWANFDTLGQGMLMEVFPDIPLLFAAWFTWDTTQPGQDETAVVGDPNNRWVTAQGPFQGSSADLDISVSRGGIFDDPTETSVESAGTMTIDFTDCSTAMVEYNMNGLAGMFTMSKIANDNLATCQAITNHIKVPFG